MEGFISSTATPPEVTIASFNGRSALISRVRFLSNSKSPFLSSLDIWLTALSGGIPESFTITGIIFRGSKSDSEFMKILPAYL